MLEIKMKVESLRKIPNPHGGYNTVSMKKSPELHIAIVNVRDIPSEIPTRTNPREQNMKTKVAAKIREGLKNDNDAFFLLNRGILLSAKEVKFDSTKHEATIVLEDLEVHGNVDGGHTLKTILKYRDELPAEQNQFVKVEIITGIEDIFDDVAAARNTSVQVQDTAIADLQDKFDKIIKDVLKNESFADNIAYRENEDKDIEVSDILSALHMFNIELYPDQNSMPVKAYSAKQSCVKHYLDTFDKHEKKNNEHIGNPYFKMRHIMADLFKLYDYIEVNLQAKYVEANPSGKYGKVKGVETAKKEQFKSKFYQTDMDYKSPKGFVYPVFAAFRALITEVDGVYEWRQGTNPIDYFSEIGKDLISETVSRSQTLGNNSNAVGKDTGLWKQLYQSVLTHYLLKQVNQNK